MADNDPRYGFRYAASNSHPCPKPEPMIVASGQAFTPDAATAARLQKGDPVKLIAGGTVDHADPGDPVFGIVAGVGNDGKVFNSTIGTNGVLHPSQFIPSNVVYGTKLDIQTKVLVVPAAGYQWEVDSDDTEADLPAWQLLIGNNADHSFTAPAASDLNATPRLATGAAATATAQWRIVRVSGTQLNQDFTGANVKLIVKLNEGAESPYSVVGT